MMGLNALRHDGLLSAVREVARDDRRRKPLSF
jgi:hypothetical protein